MTVWLNPTMSVFILFHYDVYRIHNGDHNDLVPLSDKEKQLVQKRLCRALQGAPWSPYQKNQMVLGYLRDDLEHMCEGLRDNEVVEFRVGDDSFAIRKKRRVVYTSHKAPQTMDAMVMEPYSVASS